MACIAAVACLLGACKKKEVSIDKVKDIIEQSVIAEEKDKGRVLVVDTVILHQTTGDNYKGQLLGVASDTIPVVYQLTVTDAGDDLDIEWEEQIAPPF